MRRKGNKAGEINKGKVKNEENGEKGGRRMEGGKENQPTENAEKKRISERRGRAGGGGRRSK